MINLGPFSGKNCPNVSFHPTVIDRLLEGVALLLLLAVWGSVYWLYTAKSGWISPNVWVMGGSATFTFIIVAICAYAPVRLINFPVRVNERNVGVQYLLAVRLVRFMNVILELTFLFGVFMEDYVLASILFYLPLFVLIIALIIYFIMASKYK